MHRSKKKTENYTTEVAKFILVQGKELLNRVSLSIGAHLSGNNFSDHQSSIQQMIRFPYASQEKNDTPVFRFQRIF